MKRLFAALLWCSVLSAQVAGVMPEWEVRQAAAGLEKHAAAVDGLLAQLRPDEWIAKGGPELYAEQLKQARQYNSYLTADAQAFAVHPERLSAALNTFLRLDHLQSLLASLTDGARRYQNPALADLLFSATTRNSATLEHLKEYTRQLAVEREQEWEIANREAQRCREVLAKRPPTPGKKAAPAKPVPPQ